MGHYKDSRGVGCFLPDNTDTEFYMESNYSSCNLGYILEEARDKWGEDIDITDLNIQAEYIHTNAIGYDLYDSSDYTNYLRIEYTPAKESN